MNRRNRKHLLAAGIAAGGVAAMGILHGTVARRLMALALDRKEPVLFQKGRDRLLQSEAFRPLLETMRLAAHRLENAPHETVTLTADDGTALIGHWFTCPQPRRILVAMHGWRSSWSQDFGAIAGFFADSHCCVLYAEQRGQGESGGECMGFGLSERHDCLQWARWADARSGGQLPVYLCGISMGGATVLMTAGDQLPDSVRGVIADCAYTSPSAIWEHVAHHTLHLPYGLYKAIAHSIYRRKTQIDAGEYSCPEAMKSCRVPVLFIHGTADRLVPVDMTFENYTACGAGKYLLVVPGADHGMSYLTDPRLYEQAVTAFFSACDTK